MLVIALAFATLAIPPADAQVLKKLTKAAEDVAKEATGTAKPAPQSPDVLPITDARITQFLAAIEPGRARLDKAIREMEALEADPRRVRRAKWDSCFQKGAASDVTDPKADMEKSQTLQGASMELKAKAATLEGSDKARAAKLSDSAMVLGYRATAMVFPAVRSCGDPPPAPPEAPEVEAPEPDAGWVSAEGRKAFTARQLGIFRERIAFWVVSGGKIPQGTKLGGYISYSSEELAAMTQRKAQLLALQQYFEYEPTMWTQWGDLTGW
jgi:hypothetical protein